jgi:hypothetical protein
VAVPIHIYRRKPRSKTEFQKFLNKQGSDQIRIWWSVLDKDVDNPSLDKDFRITNKIKLQKEARGAQGIDPISPSPYPTRRHQRTHAHVLPSIFYPTHARPWRALNYLSCVPSTSTSKVGLSLFGSLSNLPQYVMPMVKQVWLTYTCAWFVATIMTIFFSCCVGATRQWRVKV